MGNNHKDSKIMRIVIKIIITIILGISISSIFIYLREIKNQKQIFFDKGNNITIQASKALETWIEDQVRVVQTIASDPRIIEACVKPEDELIVSKAANYLQDIHKRYPYYENLPISLKLNKDIVKNVNGKEVTVKSGTFLIDTVGGKTIGKGGMNYSYIQEIFNGKEYYVSEIYPSIWRGNPIFVISCPVKHNNELVGVAIISPQMSYFTEKFIESVNVEKTGYMFFVDERGLIIAHKNKEYILKEPEMVDKIFRNVINRVENNETNFQEEFLGDKKLYACTKVKIDEKYLKYGWYIIFTQKNEEIFAGTSKLLNFIIIMTVISAIFIAIIVYTLLKIYDKKNHEENLIEMNKSLEKKVKERTRALQELAITDSLTKLLNHNTSYELLEHEINKARKTLNPLSIIMLDLDHFKKVNDNYGHQVGDEVLISVVQVIKSNIREIDIAGRYGGEEFIIILPNTDNNTAFMFADGIRNLISQITLDYEGLHITASLGVCSWCGENGVELVSKADKLLYKAKENGRDRVEISTINIMEF